MNLHPRMRRASATTSPDSLRPTLCSKRRKDGSLKRQVWPYKSLLQSLWPGLTSSPATDPSHFEAEIPWPKLDLTKHFRKDFLFRATCKGRPVQGRLSDIVLRVHVHPHTLERQSIAVLLSLSAPRTSISTARAHIAFPSCRVAFLPILSAPRPQPQKRYARPRGAATCNEGLNL